jgi:hypothetical protein
MRRPPPPARMTPKIRKMPSSFCPNKGLSPIASGVKK